MPAAAANAHASASANAGATTATNASNGTSAGGSGTPSASVPASATGASTNAGASSSLSSGSTMASPASSMTASLASTGLGTHSSPASRSTTTTARSASGPAHAYHAAAAGKSSGVLASLPVWTEQGHPLLHPNGLLARTFPRSQSHSGSLASAPSQKPSPPSATAGSAASLHLSSAPAHSPAAALLAAGTAPATPPLLRTPLYTPDVMVTLLLPHLMDAVSGSLPQDAWTSTTSSIVYPASSGHDAAPADPDAEARSHILQTLLETERNYVRHLHVILHAFRQPMLDAHVISETAAGLIFSGIEEVYQIHTAFLPQLEEVCAASMTDSMYAAMTPGWTPPPAHAVAHVRDPGALFLDATAQFIRTYTGFIDAYAMSKKAMKFELAHNSDYRDFLKDTSKARREATGRQSLMDLMILPVQRTARYHLILKDLLKHTPPSHRDFAALTGAWEAMTRLASEVNAMKRKEEEATGLFEAYEATKNCPPVLITHKRRLIMGLDCVVLEDKDPPGGTGTLIKPAKISKKDTHHHVFLCSDLLMLTTLIPSGGGGFRLIGTGHSGSSGSSLASPSSATGGSVPGGPPRYKFMRWMDLLELTVVEAGTPEAPMLRVTHDPRRLPPGLVSVTHPAVPIPPPPVIPLADASEAELDVAAAASAAAAAACVTTFLLRFEGRDALKARGTFLLALQNEIKQNIAARMPSPSPAPAHHPLPSHSPSPSHSHSQSQSQSPAPSYAQLQAAPSQASSQSPSPSHTPSHAASHAASQMPAAAFVAAASASAAVLVMADGETAESAAGPTARPAGSGHGHGPGASESPRPPQADPHADRTDHGEVDEYEDIC
ncbi:hypothetical protein CXG81DRAFT_20789 [Caulochytrium protostelioides]|uniref:DH domain-containing protein n=1 Tax=Caulochytrium protostelioides TaxID=1555241 RepID=A0A4P9X2Q4_9FUNG|nr:hypothetical protein CXG81DRAFT_20789 [Caulochytrium protostelioides]|eukprot:RKO99080.1 hypothetical protein CXG81DRAFT_20789 [Caulochytrium protostelioides]